MLLANDQISKEALLKINNEIFRKSIDLLFTKYKWIYDFQVTKLYSEHVFDNKFPNEWKNYFKQFKLNDLNEFIDYKKFSHTTLFESCPNELKDLLKQIDDLTPMIDQFVCSNSIEMNINQNMMRGISEKKLHEIKIMVQFVKSLCENNECKYIIDVGSGLGYFGQLLATISDVNIIGIESKDDRTQLADKRLNTMNELKNRITNVTHKVVENGENELMKIVSENVESKFLNGNSNNKNEVSRNYGLISLHSCGDLTPLMLKLFNNVNEIKYLVAFSCCYHSMKVDDDEQFANFPMSSTLKCLVKNEFNEFKMSVFAMRLACQQSKSTWLIKSDHEHESHTKQVAYRAILDKFCVDNGLKLVKTKRKLANLNEFESFNKYIESIKERALFKNDADQTIDNSESSLFDSIFSYHESFKDEFYLIEPLTALQVMFQPILENLILLDRVTYLIENNFVARLVRVFDDTISPRNTCILAERIDNSNK